MVSGHHSLPFNGLFGKALRHVAVCDQRWLALLGWQAGAFKVGVRDAWIGWSAEQQFRWLHLIANNARFVMLSHARVHNLASRVLGLSLRRVSRDMRALHGYPVLLVQTFVDPSLFFGTCYRSANWRWSGSTRRYSREPDGSARWRVNGQPKEVFVYELEANAIEALSGLDVPEQWCSGPGVQQALTTPELRSLYAFLDTMPDFRRPLGQRYSLSCYLEIMVAARLAGYRGVSAFGEFAARLSPEQLQAVGAFWSPSRQCHTAPAPSTFHCILSSLAPDTLDQALREWVALYFSQGAPVALDGKDARGASKQIAGERRMMVAAVEHGSGLVLGQFQMGNKTNEIPALRELAQQLDIEGRTVTLDALHAQQETARCLVDECQGRLRHHRGERQPADHP